MDSLRLILAEWEKVTVQYIIDDLDYIKRPSNPLLSREEELEINSLLHEAERAAKMEEISRKQKEENARRLLFYQEKAKEEAAIINAEIVEMESLRSVFTFDDFIFEVASRPSWRKLITAKQNKIPFSNEEKAALKLALEKRKKAYDPRTVLNGRYTSDLSRWAKNGKIKTVGYRRTATREIPLIDPSEDLSEERISTLFEQRRRTFPRIII